VSPVAQPLAVSPAKQEKTSTMLLHCKSAAIVAPAMARMSEY
jgi:hypothetical protein